MLNGIGLCLLAGRKASKVKILPASLLVSGSILFPGMIFYSRIYDDKRYIKFVMVGGSASVLGWLFMVLA